MSSAADNFEPVHGTTGVKADRPERIGIIARFREDLACYEWEGVTALGFWALQIYRFGHATTRLKSPIVRYPARFAHLILQKLSEMLFGITLPAQATIGRRCGFHHTSGVVIHGAAVIGDDCVIRQGVTIGNRRRDGGRFGAPRIGDRVDIGAGAKILGAITIGDDVAIGANAVVLQDIPDNCIAVGVPATIKPRRSN